MANIAKAYAISNAKISFVSLVDKAANKRQFLITKAEDNVSANFESFGRILKSEDSNDSHYVTGIVYEPMTEDSHGNYMTEDEIVKAAYWYAKNGNNVDIQHCFEPCEGAAVVESFVAKSDMEIEGQAIKKGTWLMTMEITDADIWDAIEKGEITGLSMGGIGLVSEEDVELPEEPKSVTKGLFRKFAKAMGFEVVEKGTVKADYNHRVRNDNFYSAWYALKSALEGNFYNSETQSWEWGYSSDENAIKEALEDFNDIVTKLLTSEVSIVKSLEEAVKEAPAPIEKAGKSLSAKNLNALKGIYDTLGTFLSEFEEESTTEIKKEDDEMTKEEVKKLVSEEIAKALEPITKGEAQPDPQPEEPEEATAEDIASIVKAEISSALEPILRSRSLPQNLNGLDGVNNEIEKAEHHYMEGIF